MRNLLLGLTLFTSLSFLGADAQASCEVHSTNSACQTRICTYWDHSEWYTMCDLQNGAWRHETCYYGYMPWNSGYSGCTETMTCPSGTLCYY